LLILEVTSATVNKIKIIVQNRIWDRGNAALLRAGNGDFNTAKIGIRLHRRRRKNANRLILIIVDVGMDVAHWKKRLLKFYKTVFVIDIIPEYFTVFFGNQANLCKKKMDVSFHQIIMVLIYFLNPFDLFLKLLTDD
jgi:hypothetical protein